MGVHGSNGYGPWELSDISSSCDQKIASHVFLRSRTGAIAYGRGKLLQCAFHRAWNISVKLYTGMHSVWRVFVH